MITRVGANNLTLATLNNDKVTPIAAAVGEGRVDPADLSGVTALLSPFDANVTVVDEGTSEMLINGHLQTVGRLRLNVTNENVTQDSFVREIVVRATYQGGEPFVLIASSLGNGDDINNMLPAPSVPGVVTKQLEFMLVYFISPEEYSSLDVRIISLGEGAPRYHASETTEFGLGTDNRFGHLRLCDAVDSNLGVGDGVAATPSAVNAVAQMINSASQGFSFNVTIQRGVRAREFSGSPVPPGWLPTPIPINPVNLQRSILIINSQHPGIVINAFPQLEGLGGLSHAATLTESAIVPNRFGNALAGQPGTVSFSWQVITFN